MATALRLARPTICRHVCKQASIPLLSRSPAQRATPPRRTIIGQRPTATTVQGIRMISSAAKGRLSDASLFKDEAYVDGKWIKASSGNTFDVEDPATGETIGSCPDMDVADTRAAIAAAKKAFTSWKKTTAKHRHDLLMKYFNLLTQHSDDVAALITLENGKALTEAKGEAAYAASYYEWFAEEAVRNYGDVIPSAVPTQRNVVVKQPIGVCGILCPWNFPAAMMSLFVHSEKLALTSSVSTSPAKLSAPALAAGCTVVIKAPAEAPFTSLALAELADRAGIPPGVLNVLTTDKGTKDIGKELCENGDVRKVSFTGSTAVGKLLMSQSASTLKKLSFELGGNAPFIVFDDADIEAAVKGAIGCKFRGSGQTCVSANRLFIHAPIYSEFASRFTAEVRKFHVGNGFDEGVTHGPVIHQRGLDKVVDHVKRATKGGSEVLVGGKPVDGKGYFFQPTVLSDVPTGIIDQEETFGPVAALYRFETEDEVISLANDTDVGLASYVFTNSLSRAWRVSEGLESGMVGLNTGMLSSAVIPFGGVKQSGFGREGSKYGIDEYQIVKLIAMGGLEQ